MATTTTRTMNAPEARIDGTACTVEIRNGWHVVRKGGEVIGKRYDMENAVKLAMEQGPAPADDVVYLTDELYMEVVNTPIDADDTDETVDMGLPARLDAQRDADLKARRAILSGTATPITRPTSDDVHYAWSSAPMTIIRRVGELADDFALRACIELGWVSVVVLANADGRPIGISHSGAGCRMI